MSCRVRIIETDQWSAPSLTLEARVPNSGSYLAIETAIVMATILKSDAKVGPAPGSSFLSRPCPEVSQILLHANDNWRRVESGFSARHRPWL